MNPSGGSDTDQDQLHSVRPAAQQGVTFDAIQATAIQNTGSLDADFGTSRAQIEGDRHKTKQHLLGNEALKTRARLFKLGALGLLILGGVIFILLQHNTKKDLSSQETGVKSRFNVTSLPIADIGNNYPSLSVQNTQTLSINGQLNVNNALVLMPTTQPKTAVTGQLYYDQTTNKLSYYDGTSFVNLLSGNQVVTSVGGANGTITTGNGLTVTGSTIDNSGVLTIQGQSGNVSLVAGTGIAVSGTTLSNSGLLSLGGQSGNILLGTGLSLSGNTLNAQTGIQNLSAATNNVTVTDLGNGTWSIGVSVSGGGGSGTVASSGGTVGKLAYFAGVQDIEDSLVSQSGGVVTVGGNLSVTGGVTLGAPLTVANGGTGATTAAGARTSLGVAASGANSDITSLSGLTTALSVSQGGTGIGVLPTNSVLVGNGTSPISGVTAATPGQCLISTAGTPSFQTCPGSGGVASVNSLTGALTITGVSGGSITSAGTTITINDATSATKGLASFNSADLTVTAGNVDTVQGIATTSTPTFGQLTLTSAQAAADMLVVNNTNAGATGNLLNLKLNGSSKLAVSPAGSLTLSGNVNGQTISAAANFTGTVAVASTLTVNTISPTSSLAIGVGAQSFTLQGNASSTIKATAGANTTSVGFQSPTANVTYNFATALAGSYDICTKAGNCVGIGSSVTSPGGTPNTLAKFTSSNAIADSIISDNGSTATIAGVLSVNTITPTAALTVGAASQSLMLQGAGVSVSDTAGGITNSLVFATPAGSIKTITLPNASGTVAVSASGPINIDASGNLSCPTCLTSGGGGGSAGVSSLNSATGSLILQGVAATSITTAGSTITINDASSTIKGLASFSTTNLTVTSGNVDTVQSIAVTATPTFAGLSLTSALTVTNGGTGATTASGARTNLGAAASGANSDITSLSGLTTALSVLQGGTGATSLTANGVLVGNGTSPVTSVTGSNGQCLMVVSGTPAFGACPGSGASPVTSLDGLTGALTINNSTGTGSAITINNAAADGSTKGIATFNGTNFKDNGAGVINTIQDIATSSSPSFAGLSLGAPLTVTNGGTGANTAAGARTNLGAAASGANSDITSLSGLTTALSVSQGGTGLTALTANQLLVANSTTSITQLTNGTSGQCLVSNGAGSAPSFQTCTGAGGVSSLDSLTGSITLANSSGSAGTITINDAAADGTTKGIAAFNGTNFTASTGVINTIQGISTTASPTFANITISSTINANTLTPSSALVVGATTQSFTLQGNAASKLTATNGSFSTTVGFSGAATGNTIYNFDQSAASGTYIICTNIGNCAGSGTGVTTSGGTINAIPKFTGSQSLGNSGLSDNGTTISTAEQIQGGTILTGGSVDRATAGTLSVGTTTATGVTVGNTTSTNPALVQGGTSGITLTTTGSTVVKQSGTATATAFQVQNVAGTATYLDVDALNGRVGIGTNAPSEQLDVTGQIPSSTIASAFASSSPTYDVATEGQFAYTASYGKFDTWDITRPSAPVKLGTLTTSTGIVSVKVSGKYAFEVNGTNNQVYIINVSNPSSPSLTATIGASISLGTLNQVNSAVAQGRYLYIAGSTAGNNYILVYDIANPSTPQYIANVTESQGVDSLAVQGTYLYATVAATGLQIVDISNPASPVNKGALSSAVPTNTVIVQGRYAYLAGGTTLQAVNVSNPNSPASVGTVTLDSSESNIVLQGKYIYAAISTSHEVQVVNVSNPASMSIAGTVAAGTEVRSIALAGPYAYVSDYTNGKLLVYDMGGANIQLLQAGSVTATSLDVSSSLQVEGAASFSNGLRVNQGFSVDGNTSIQGAFQIQNSSGASILNADITNSQVTLGTASSLAGKLVFYNASNSNAITFQAATSGSGNNTITIPNETGTLCTTASTVCSLQTAYNASTGGANATPTIKLSNTIADLNIQDADATLGLGGNFLSLRSSNSGGLGNVVFGFGVQGRYFEKPTVDSSRAMVLENSEGNTLFSADTSCNTGTPANTCYINLGSTTGSTGGSPDGNAFNKTVVNIETSPNANTTTNIGSTAQNSGTATINIGYTNTSGGGSNVNIGSGPTATGTTTIQGNGVTITGAASALQLLTSTVASGSSGSLYVRTGDTGSGASGNISIDTGAYTAVGGTTTPENDTFESGTGACNSGTSPWNTWFADSCVATTAAKAHSGSRSMIATVTASTAWGVQTNFPSGATIVAGQSYSFSMWVRAASASQSIIFDAQWINGSTQVGNVFNLGTASDSASGWTQITGTAIAAPGANGIYMTIRGNGSTDTSVYIDDVTITGVGAPVIALGSANANTITIGNSNETGVTSLLGGSGGILLQSASTGTIKLQTTGITNTTSGSSVTIASSTDSATAFQIQNAASATLLNVSTSQGTLTTYGGSLTVNGVANPTAPTLTSSGSGGTLAANTYYYRLDALATDGSSTTASIPSSPGSVTTSGSTSKNTLTWSAVTNATGYHIYRSIDGGNTWFVNQVSSATTSIVDNGSTYTWATPGSVSNFSNAGGINLQKGTGVTFDAGTGGTYQMEIFDNVNGNNTFTMGNYNASGAIDMQASSFYITDTSTYNHDFSMASTGAITLKANATSSNAFLIQNPSSVNMFNVDTSLEKITIGPSGGDTVGEILVLGTKTTTGDPTGAEGAIYYNNALKEFRCYENGYWGGCEVAQVQAGFSVTDEFLGGGTSNTNGAIGEAGWTRNFINCSQGPCSLDFNNGIAPTADHPGILRVRPNNTGPVTNAGEDLVLGNGSAGSMALSAGYDVKTTAGVESSASNTVTFRIGLHNETSSTTAPTTGVWWEADPTVSSNWRLCYVNATPAVVCSAGNTPTAIVANAFVRLEIHITALGSGTSNVVFSINGNSTTVSGVTVNTTNLVWPNILTYAQPASEQDSDIDYFQVSGTATGLR